MSVQKEDVVEIFRKSSRLSQFKLQMSKLGFNFNDKGCNKYVFVHPRICWVTKLVFGVEEQFPDPKSKIAKYFLWPEDTGQSRVWFGNYYELWFQPKVNFRSYRRAYQELMETFRNENISWTKDNHDWNVGHYKGEPMIFDF